MPCVPGYLAIPGFLQGVRMTSGFAASDGFGAGAIGQRRLDRNGRGRGAAWRRVPQVVAVCLAMAGAASNAFGIDGSPSQRRPPPHKWTTFVQVDGQPEPVPAEWVATPEGRFAHSLKIPNPVPKDSGYRWWMSSKDYFKHLCDTEAGEFIYEKVENVEGFLFMRPPGWPSDSSLMDARTLEAPGFELTYQLMSDDILSRSTLFVSSHEPFKYVEEPNPASPIGSTSVMRASGYSKGTKLDQLTVLDQSQSTYAFTWRGVRRKADRENRIAGYELIVFRRDNGKVIAVLRDFQRSGVSGGRVWWLSASYCPRSRDLYGRPELFETSRFVARALNTPLQ